MLDIEDHRDRHAVNDYNQILYEAISRLGRSIPVPDGDKYAAGYRDGLANAREILGEMLVG